MVRTLRPWGLLIFFIGLMAGCGGTTGTHPLFTPSGAEVVREYSSFAEYKEKSEQLIARHRVFLSDAHQEEVAVNAPFERKPSAMTQKGVLLVHGLGDSPWSFVDIADTLAEQGWLVRTVLLPGHGTRPADLIDARVDDWQALVTRQVELMKQSVPEVYLGGFSTGANLALLHALDDPEIKGLMLFSPAFQPDTELSRLTPLLAVFKDWLLTNPPESADNPVRYMATPTNGFAQYSHTSQAVLEKLADKTFDRPVFMVLSEHDSVVDANAVKELFMDRFTHPDNQLMWFGTTPIKQTRQVHYVDSQIPELQISNMSHMGIMFSPDNDYYGQGRPARICRNGADSEAISHCQQGKPVWYSAWGYQEPGKVHARLTFNPAFEDMMNLLSATFAPEDGV